jgi:hypothetical protein
MLIVYTPGWAKVWLAMTFGVFAVLGPTVLIVWAEEESPQLMVICCCVVEQLPLDTRALAAVGSLLVHSLIWPPKTHWLDGTWVVLPAGAEEAEGAAEVALAEAATWLVLSDPLVHPASKTATEMAVMETAVFLAAVSRRQDAWSPRVA